MENFLIAIIPSEDIAIRIRTLRTVIFRQFGLISSRCLPEMIPVTYTDGFINKKQFSGITLPEALTSSTGGSIGGNDFFLQINKTDIINTISEKIYSPVTTGIISLKEGFYLGTADRNTNTSDVLRYIDSKTEKILQWEKNSLELIHIETNCDTWWESIRWEIIWRQKLRLSEN